MDNIDWFDLNDWVSEHCPEVYAVTKYLGMNIQFELWFKLYSEAHR